MESTFKYYPSDFGELPVTVIHFDLLFDIFDDRTTVTAQLKVKTKKPLHELQLDAKNLEIHNVSSSWSDCTFVYEKEKDKLFIKFKKRIPAGIELILKTKTTCRPTKNILEGLYYDETPPNCPPTQITQCQQWGFQRLVPCFDDMTAKARYMTTIIADQRYTNIISNGDLVEDRKEVASGRVRVKYDNTTTPMAPYLFFLGVGTYATFTKKVQYPDGKTFMLELLVPPQSAKEHAQQALEILSDSILWIHLFTGPDKYKNMEKSKNIWQLLKRRDAGEPVQQEIALMLQGMQLGYQYTGTVYREIGMQNSNFGGMENVGNTAIVTNRIMPFKQMTDPSFEYLFAVKSHEFYHNLNGSEVTGFSPFEIWLNEAVTVHIERDYTSFVFGERYHRLQEVLMLLTPGNGTLALDATPLSLPIEPDGFNNPDELISSITYVKAPEFIRMIETTIGKETFVHGLDAYHTAYKHRNATRKQWIACMEKISGKKLQSMAQHWLKQTKYPVLYVTKNYDTQTKKLTLFLEQKIPVGAGCWEFPFVVALCKKDGSTLVEKIAHIQQQKEVIDFANVEEPAFLSLNRGYSFYGKVNYRATAEELFTQVHHDTDIVNKYMAFYELCDWEKHRLLQDKTARVDTKIVDLCYAFLNDKELMADVGPSCLMIFEDVNDERFAHKYQDLFEVKEKILKAIAQTYKKELLLLYEHYLRKAYTGTVVEQRVASIKNRQTKNTLLGILARLDTAEIHALIKKQFTTATNATDTLTAFKLYINSTASDKEALMASYQQEAQQHLVSWEAFLSVIGNNDSPDYLDSIKRIEQSSSFRIEQSNDQRALYGLFAYNKKKSLLTAAGRTYLKDCILKLAPINEYNTLHLLKTLGTLDKIDAEHQAPLVKMIEEILQQLSQEKTPSAYNSLKRILLGSTKAIEAYTKAGGKIQTV